MDASSNRGWLGRHAWVGPFSRRTQVRDATIDAALVEAVGQLVRDPVLS
ncbi:MAG: hypothetical protein ACLQVI_14765 [Polyangiaceae bacterium]